MLKAEDQGKACNIKSDPTLYPKECRFVAVAYEIENKIGNTYFTECTKGFGATTLAKLGWGSSKNYDCIKINVDGSKYTEKPNFCYETKGDKRDYANFLTFTGEVLVQGAASMYAGPVGKCGIGFMSGALGNAIRFGLASADKWPNGGIG